MPPVRLQHRVDALIERCYAGLDSGALRREVVRRLQALAGVDAAFVATVDPATLLFTSVTSQEPLIQAGPVFLANELGGLDVNRFTELAAADDPVRTLDQATRGDRDSSPRHAAIMRPLGLGDELRVALRTRQACWGVMCLHREADATGFSPRDRDIVAKIAPHVAEGLRRALLAESAVGEPHPTLGHGVVILDADGAVTSVNDAAERWLARSPKTTGQAHASCRYPCSPRPPRSMTPGQPRSARRPASGCAPLVGTGCRCMPRGCTATATGPPS